MKFNTYKYCRSKEKLNSIVVESQGGKHPKLCQSNAFIVRCESDRDEQRYVLLNLNRSHSVIIFIVKIYEL